MLLLVGHLMSQHQAKWISQSTKLHCCSGHWGTLPFTVHKAPLWSRSLGNSAFHSPQSSTVAQVTGELCLSQSTKFHCGPGHWGTLPVTVHKAQLWLRSLGNSAFHSLYTRELCLSRPAHWGTLPFTACTLGNSAFHGLHTGELCLSRPAHWGTLPFTACTLGNSALYSLYTGELCLSQPVHWGTLPFTACTLGNSALYSLYTGELCLSQPAHCVTLPFTACTLCNSAFHSLHTV